MQKKIKKDLSQKYICPFCLQEIKASKKTDVLYRKLWIKGCNDCFILSIGKETSYLFQTKVIEGLS